MSTLLIARLGPRQFRGWAARLVWAVAACAACDPNAAPVVIGAAGPWEREYAAMTRRGIQLAAEQINRSGGIGGQPLQVAFRNDSADAARAVSVASTFVADARIKGVIGHVNSGALVAAANVYDGHLVAVAPTAASPELVGISPWVFRLITNDSVFGVELGRRASRLGSRAAVLYDNNSFGRGGAESFRRNFAGTLVRSDPIWPGDTALAPFVEFYKRQGVDLVFVAGVTPSGLALLREAERQTFAGAILGTDSWTALAEQAPVSQRAFVATRFTALDPRAEVTRFVRHFRRRFGHEPDSFAAYGYDSTWLLARALREAGTDREAVREYLDALARRGAFAGVTGPIAFSDTGDPVQGGFVLLQVRNGALVLADR